MTKSFILRGTKENEENYPHFQNNQHNERVTILEQKQAFTEQNLIKLEKTTEKHFDELNQKLDKRFLEIKDEFRHNLQDIKKEIHTQTTKLNEIEDKVDHIKNGLTAVVAKFGLVFSALCSIGLIAINFFIDKFK